MRAILAGKNAAATDLDMTPIFYLYENDKSTAELSAEEKNAISHRGKALRQMKKMLEEQK